MIAGTLWLIIVNSGFSLIGIWIWKRVWVSRFGVKIPENPSTIFSFSLLFPAMKPIIWNLPEEYFIKHTGLDGYIYLLFQRFLLKLLFAYTILAVIVSIPMNLSHSNEETFFTRTTLPKIMSPFTSSMQVLVTYIFSIGVLITIYVFRAKVGGLLEAQVLMRSRENEHKWFLLRTVQVRGLKTCDVEGLMLMFNRYLMQRGGKVVEANLIPDYQDLLKLDIERHNAKLMVRLYNGEIERPQSNFSPRSISTNNHHSLKLESIEKKLQLALRKPAANSGHALVVFNSLASMEKVLYHYRQSPSRTLWSTLKKIKDRWDRWRSRRVFEGSFEKFEEEEMGNVKVSRGVDPSDFIWQNIGGGPRLDFLRRFGLMLLSVLILLFLSTPAALLAVVKSAVGIVDVALMSDALTNVAQAYLPSISIVLLNQLLLLLIDISAYMERHYSHTKVQSVVLHKSVIYLTLNMLIIPGLTIAASKSLLKIVSDKEFLLADILGELHVADFGAFLINVLLQKATFSSMFYLLRGTEIGTSYFSSWVAHHIREDLNGHKKWRRHESQVFQYGYFYALNLACFGIVITFCSTVPLVIPAGFWYFLLKHLVDAHNLLSVHGKEIESNGNLARSACNYTIIFVWFYQISMIGYFSVNDMRFQALAVFGLMLASLLFGVKYSGPLFDISMNDGEYYANSVDSSASRGERWKELYQYPLD